VAVVELLSGNELSNGHSDGIPAVPEKVAGWTNVVWHGRAVPWRALRAGCDFMRGRCPIRHLLYAHLPDLRQFGFCGDLCGNMSAGRCGLLGRLFAPSGAACEPCRLNFFTACGPGMKEEQRLALAAAEQRPMKIPRSSQ